MFSSSRSSTGIVVLKWRRLVVALAVHSNSSVVEKAVAAGCMAHMCDRR